MAEVSQEHGLAKVRHRLCLEVGGRVSRHFFGINQASRTTFTAKD
jgi:hypothetical protein